MAIIGKVSIYEKFMRGVAKISRVRLTFQGAATIQPEYYGVANVDSPPLAGDYAVAVDTEGTGARAIVGCLDPNNAQLAAGGEFRAYARNAAGEQVAELWLKGNGSGKLSNANGFIELLPNGKVSINGLIIDDHTHLYQDTGAGVNPSTTQGPQ